MNNLVHAELDLGTLIYIVMVFIWLVANAFGKKKKGGRTAPRIPAPDETSAERELREMLETLAGKPQPVEEEFEEMSPEPEPVVVARKRPAAAAPAPPPVIPFPVPAVSRVADRAEPVINIEELSRELQRNAPSMAGSFSSTLSSMASLFKTSGLTMPALRYALSTNTARNLDPVLSGKILEDRNQLRRIVAGRIVLGPPRALEPWKAETEATRAGA